MRHSKAFIAKQAARMQRAEEIIGAGHQTVRSMASNLLVSLVTARKILDGMLAENKAYTWMQPAQPGHSPMRFYAAGTRSRGEKLQQIIRHLSVDPLSMKELCLVMGCGTMTAHRALMELKAQNRIHVARWTPVGRNYEQLWTAGAGQDAPKPKPMTTTQKYKVRAVRMKLDPEMAIREANRRKAKALVPRRDPFVAALFGPAGQITTITTEEE